MRVFIIGLFVVVLLSTVGLFGWQFLSKLQASQTAAYQTEAVKRIGVLKAGKGDDYNHILLANGKSIGVTSYTIKLDDYVGQKVEITGQFSGTTLYADSVVAAP